MTTINAAEAGADLCKYINAALNEPIRITSERGTVVMISEEEWENIPETLYITGVPGLTEEIKKNRKLPESEFARWNGLGL